MLKNKVVVITGAGTGLGKAVAVKVAALGAKVAIVGKTEVELKEVKSEINKSEGIAEYFVCDITQADEVKRAVQAVVKTYGHIDVLINNAGIWTDEELEANRPELRKKALETNVLGHIQFTYEVLPIFQKKNAGYILNVISTAGASDTPAGNNTRWKTYGASKWAMTGFTKSLRESLMETKIRVTAFHPGGFDSMLYEKANRPNPHNQPWMMDTNDVADIVVFALTRPAGVMMEKIIVSHVNK
ncbi:hypothetical protein A2W24_06190 [Microgenomates group bacterium RBG_16_45_19]|nr:MAG: hypothetical protein A2W24_06190 [Microgenomates group bacterium RBG_16_45_19]